jgi:hypothetical protein
MSVSRYEASTDYCGRAINDNDKDNDKDKDKDKDKIFVTPKAQQNNATCTVKPSLVTLLTCALIRYSK